MAIIYKKCTIKNCEMEMYSKNMCRKHYERVKKWGDPNIVRTSYYGRKINGIPRSQHPLYHTWFSIIQRCEKAGTREFKYYGARGIKVCSRWKDSFESFVNDMGEKPTPQHSIDRINNDGNYTPENCRWADKSQQASNRRPAKENVTGYIGVVPRRITRYYAHFTRKGKYHHVGMFDTAKQAFEAREKALKAYRLEDE